MRLFILSMPAVALVAVFSLSLQRSMVSNTAQDTQSALPEATRIYHRVMAAHGFDANRSFAPLAAKRPLVITPATGDSGAEW